MKTRLLTYKGCSARVAFDPRDGVFVGRAVGLKDGISFHGETVSELRDGFRAAIDHYLADCREQGRVPEKPASGRMMLRVPPDVHAAASQAAAADGKSLNQWAIEVLGRAAA